MSGAVVTEFGVEGIVDGAFFLGRGGFGITCMCGFDVPKLNCKPNSITMIKPQALNPT